MTGYNEMTFQNCRGEQRSAKAGSYAETVLTTKIMASMGWNLSQSQLVIPGVMSVDNTETVHSLVEESLS